MRGEGGIEVGVYVLWVGGWVRDLFVASQSISSKENTSEYVYCRVYYYTAVYTCLLNVLRHLFLIFLFFYCASMNLFFFKI